MPALVSPLSSSFGREARVLADVLIPNRVDISQGSGVLQEYMPSLVGRLERAFSAAKLHATEAHERQKLYHDEDS